MVKSYHILFHSPHPVRGIRNNNEMFGEILSLFLLPISFGGKRGSQKLASSAQRRKKSPKIDTRKNLLGQEQRMMQAWNICKKGMSEDFQLEKRREKMLTLRCFSLSSDSVSTPCIGFRAHPICLYPIIYHHQIHLSHISYHS